MDNDEIVPSRIRSFVTWPQFFLSVRNANIRPEYLVQVGTLPSFEISFPFWMPPSKI